MKKLISIFSRKAKPPVGYWRCTSASNDKAGFEAGQTYRCEIDSFGHPRLYSNKEHVFALYWNVVTNTFDSKRTALEFAFLGSAAPAIATDKAA